MEAVWLKRERHNGQSRNLEKSITSARSQLRELKPLKEFRWRFLTLTERALKEWRAIDIWVRSTFRRTWKHWHGSAPWVKSMLWVSLSCEIHFPFQQHYHYLPQDKKVLAPLTYCRHASSKENLILLWLPFVIFLFSMAWPLETKFGWMTSAFSSGSS